MSAELAHALGAVVAANIREWRGRRNLDQQQLADRVGELGWPTDRTTISRIEGGDRKVSVDNLGVLAIALGVPLTVLLLPIHRSTATDVTLTKASPPASVNRWLLWEWLLGNEPLPGRIAPFGDEWRSGAEPLWLYEAVRAAQLDVQRVERRIGAGQPEGVDYVEALQALVDAVAEMEDAGLPADDLIAPAWHDAITARKLERSPAPRRPRLIEHLGEVLAQP